MKYKLLTREEASTFFHLGAPVEWRFYRTGTPCESTWDKLRNEVYLKKEKGYEDEYRIEVE
mgnify:CR=1 FL=1